MISEDEALLKANELHPELSAWRPKDFERAEKRDGINWSLHLQMDCVVLRRASDASLPDAEVIRSLQEKGVSYLDAIHRIARLVAEDLWVRMKEASSEPGKSTVPKEKLDEFAREQNRTFNEKIKQLAVT